MINFLYSVFTGTLIPMILICPGIYFSFRLGFFHLLHPVTIMRSFFTAPKGKSGISPFKAVTVALAGTLGVGNIAGVATAIAAGGPGAVFWMWISALGAMVLKYAEVMLGVYYRKKTAAGYTGGAAYYISRGLGSRGLAVLFSVLFLISSFTMGNVIQTKAVCDSLAGTLGLSGIFSAIIVALPVVLVVKGGIKKISSFTVKLIPALCLIYSALSLYIIICEAGRLPGIFALIFKSAFSLKSGVSGVGGYTFAKALRYGVSRGIASNEAGCGTAPTAHANADTDSPVRQGFWGLFEVFADTILLCTLTALAILLAFGSDIVSDGMPLAISAYEKYFGSAAGIIMCISVYFFALSTVICWYHYGSEALFFITKNRYENAFFVLYLLMFFVSPTIPSVTIWEISDLIFGLMTAVNVCCLIRLRKVVIDQTNGYFKPKTVLKRSQK